MNCISMRVGGCRATEEGQRAGVAQVPILFAPSAKSFRLRSRNSDSLVRIKTRRQEHSPRKAGHPLAFLKINSNNSDLCGASNSVTYTPFHTIILLSGQRPLSRRRPMREVISGLSLARSLAVPPSLQVSIPTRHTLHAKTVLSLFASLPQVRGYQTQLRLLESQSLLDQSRSLLLTEWYDRAGDDDLFLSLDPDLTFTGEDLNAVIALGGDVAVLAALCGPNRINLLPRHETRFRAGTDPEILYGSGGFMLIRKPILRRLVPLLQVEHGAERLWIGEEAASVMPFFRQRTIDSPQGSGQRREWLSDDFAFCWLVRQAGGTLRGRISPTLGRELPELKYLRPG